MSMLFIAFLQAAGLVLYCSLVGSFMIHGNSWFPLPQSFLGPTLFLSIFVISAVICSLIFLGYPFWLFWQQKLPQKAIKLVIYTTVWLAIFILTALAIFTHLPRQIQPNPTPTPPPSPVSYKTSCQTDSDCMLMNVNDKNCCGPTGCEDKSTDNWIAVNTKWYSTDYQVSCKKGPCPLAQCSPPAPGTPTFVPKCISNHCTKLGGL